MKKKHQTVTSSFITTNNLNPRKLVRTSSRNVYNLEAFDGPVEESRRIEPVTLTDVEQFLWDKIQELQENIRTIRPLDSVTKAPKKGFFSR